MTEEEKRALYVVERKEKWAAMWAAYAEQGLHPFPLWEGEPPVKHTEGFTPQLLVYPAHEGAPRGMVIVCAGGGFWFKSHDEAKPVADFFYAQGLNAAVLDYNVEPLNGWNDPDTQLGALADAQRAIRTIRHHAKEWKVLPDKIAIGGFSAGGVLSGMASVYFDAGDPDAADPIERESSRPDACLLIYGAFVANSRCVSGEGRSYDFAGMNAAMTQPARYDLHLRLDCPPFFITQTCHDDPRNAMYLGLELANRGIPFEVHTFEEGHHGGALYNGCTPDTPDVKHTCLWAPIAADWLTVNRQF